MTMLVPESLAKTPDRKLEIVWSDGQKQTIPFRLLRTECPCATCREKAEGKAAKESKSKSLGALPVLSPAEAQPLDIISMQPVGNYAYNIKFSDNHSSGIFTFDFLRALGEKS